MWLTSFPRSKSCNPDLRIGHSHEAWVSSPCILFLLNGHRSKGQQQSIMDSAGNSERINLAAIPRAKPKKTGEKKPKLAV